MIHASILLCAYLIDRLVGDPRSIPHPVTLMGVVVVWLERKILSLGLYGQKLKMAGLSFPIILAGGSYLLVWILLEGLSVIHPWLAFLAEIWIISTTIATKGLAEAGMEIYHFLKKEDIIKARKSLSMVVGRDTEFLESTEISRGAVETVAENIVDAILSPLFFAALGGAPLAMAYRAVNTLDSMIGYKNEKYEHLGWASARLDDLANYVPARLAAIILVLACKLRRLDSLACWQAIRRDARLHPSPNSGYTEAGIAGALGIQLGGLNHYKGVPSHRAKLWDPLRQIEPDDIAETVKVMKLVSSLFLVFCIGGILSINLLI